MQNHQSTISYADPKKQKGKISSGHEHPKAKEARKERKVLEKKMALNRKRKLGSKWVMFEHINVAHISRFLFNPFILATQITAVIEERNLKLLTY